MGRYTPAWAAGLALGVSMVVLGFAIEHDIALLGGIVITLGSLAGQAFVPGPTTEEEREREAEVRGSVVGNDQDDEPRDPLDTARTDVPRDPTVERMKEVREETDAPDRQRHPEEHDEPPGERRAAGPGGSTGNGGGVTRGKCGNCGTRLKLSDRRPVKAICPQCGRSRVLER